MEISERSSSMSTAPPRFGKRPDFLRVFLSTLPSTSLAIAITPLATYTLKGGHRKHLNSNIIIGLMALLLATVHNLANLYLYLYLYLYLGTVALLIIFSKSFDIFFIFFWWHFDNLANLCTFPMTSDPLAGTWSPAKGVCMITLFQGSFVTTWQFKET